MDINFHTLSIQNNAYIPPTSKNNPFQVSQERTPLQTGETGENYISKVPIEVLIKILGFAFASETESRYSDASRLCALKFISRQFCDGINMLLTTGDAYGIKAQQQWSKAVIINYISRSRYVENMPAIKELLRGIKHLEIYFGGRHNQYSFCGISSSIDMLLNFLRAIAELKKLKTLDIYIGEVPANIFIDNVIHILKESQNLYSVYLHFYDNRLTAADMEKLGSALTKSIAKFCLSRNPIESAGIKNLAPYFQNTSIFYLGLDNVNIGNEGLRLLAENLPEGKLPETLELLSLEDNNIDHEGLSYLNSILPNNIKNIDLSENNIGNEGVPHIVDLLKNKGIEKLYLGANNITFKHRGAEVLIDELCHTEIRFLDLRNNSGTNNKIENFKIKNKNNKEVKIDVIMSEYAPPSIPFD